MRQLLAVMMLLISSVGYAQSYVCPKCGKVHNTQTLSPQRSVLPGQAVAQARANYMARRNYRNHPPSSVGGGFASVGGFEGVGWTSRRNAPQRSIGTCRPSGPSGSQDDNSSRLIGDAVAYGNGGSYRVRIWASGGGGGSRIRSLPSRFRFRR